MAGHTVPQFPCARIGKFLIAFRTGSACHENLPTAEYVHPEKDACAAVRPAFLHGYQLNHLFRLDTRRICVVERGGRKSRLRNQAEIEQLLRAGARTTLVLAPSAAPG